MRWRRTQLIRAVVVAAVAALFLSPVFGQPGNTATFSRGLLFVVQDESSLEEQIAGYLETVHGYTSVERRTFNNAPNDLFVAAPISAGSAPPLLVRADTFPIEGHRQGRSIRIYAFYVLPDSAKTPQAVDRLLELNNSYHIREYPSRFCIDNDGDILIEQWIRIPNAAVPVHAELVAEAFRSMGKNWETYWAGLSKELNL